MMKLATALVFVLTSLIAFGQESSKQCGDVMNSAKAWYANGQLDSCLHTIEKGHTACDTVPDKLNDMLLLRAVTEWRLDSSKAMYRTLEQMLRNDRKLRLTPDREYLRDQKEVWIAYHEEVRPAYRKDHGAQRAGIHFSMVFTQLQLKERPVVFASDQELSPTVSTTGSSGLHYEIDVIPNLSLRTSADYLHMAYAVHSPTLEYNEDLNAVAFSLGLKKAFWFRGSSIVPHVFVRGSYGRILSAESRVDRTGSGTAMSYLDSKRWDRINERNPDEYWVGAGFGMGRKFGNSIVVFLEFAYDQGLTEVTRSDTPYAESEALVEYYYVDAPFHLNRGSIVLGGQYVIKYHEKNRLYR